MKKLFLFILIVFSVLIISLLIIWKINARKSTPKSGTTITPTVIQKLNRGEIIIGATANEYTTIDSLVELFAVANGNNNDIIGFDISLNYDKEYLKFIEAENLLIDQFDVFSSQKDNLLFISGIKKLDDQNKVIFKNNQIIKLQFQAIKKGKTKLVLVRHDNDMSESNMITESNLDILDKVDAPTIYIDEVINLKKSQTVIFNNDIKITLTDFNVASGSCRDCLTYAKILVNNKEKKHELFFKIGGFAGYLINQLPIDNYIFLLKEVKTDSVDLVIYEV